MTGFGQARARTVTGEVETVVRAVNGRFLEIRFHLPREMMAIEGEIKKILESYFSRGTIDVYLNRKAKGAKAGVGLHLNEALVKEYVGALRQVNKLLKTKSQWSADGLLRMPEVLAVQEAEFDVEVEKKGILAAVKSACEACQGERLREGKSLQKDLLKKHAELAEIIRQIWSVRDSANQELQARMSEKIRAKMAQAEIAHQLDPQRVAQEVTLLLEKSDISEEVTRLEEHLAQYGKMLGSGESSAAKGAGPQGKSLDFYTQELLREVNTIGSKSHLSKLTQLVVEAKTTIERLREQVQNVE